MDGSSDSYCSQSHLYKGIISGNDPKTTASSLSQNNWSNRALIPSQDRDKETMNKEWGVLAASSAKGQKRRGQLSLWILFTVTAVLPRSVRAQTPPVVPNPHSAAVGIFTHLPRRTTLHFIQRHTQTNVLDNSSKQQNKFSKQSSKGFEFSDLKIWLNLRTYTAKKIQKWRNYTTKVTGTVKKMSPISFL